MSKKRRPTFAVDLDGTILAYDGWKGIDVLGDPLPGAKEFLQTLRAIGQVMIYTTRCCMVVNKPLTPDILVEKVRIHLDKHELPYDTIYSGQGKPPATIYIDDRAISCRPQDDPDALMKTLELIKAFLAA